MLSCAATKSMMANFTTLLLDDFRNWHKLSKKWCAMSCQIALRLFSADVATTRSTRYPYWYAYVIVRVRLQESIFGSFFSVEQRFSRRLAHHKFVGYVLKAHRKSFENLVLITGQHTDKRSVCAHDLSDIYQLSQFLVELCEERLAERLLELHQESQRTSFKHM